ncbi:MAG TPA: substrate-binding domain-containing protein [Candidatus Dormibacteraeota bacterium]|nr:substrate-binding domain-containing protein [Candidatus Dormibacteraeota bacterium]
MTRPFLVFFVLVFASTGLFAQEPDYLKELKPYRPQQRVSGTIRNWGNNYIPELMKRWEEGFRRFQPGVHFETNLKGTETGVAGLYGDIADIAFVGRELYASEREGFQERFGYQPLEMEISSGSYNTPHKTFALMAFVHKENPLAKLTMAQLEAIFGCELRGSTKSAIRTWGQLGLTGEWASQPIHVYAFNFKTGMARFFQKVVLQDSFKWNSELRDFDNRRTPEGDVINAGVYVLEALAKDRYGIAYGNILHGNPSVKMVALARANAGPYIEPTKENVWRRTYPLTRFTNAVINRPPGKPVDPTIKEFLRYILSRDGMQAVVQDGAYLPLTQKLIEAQLRKLGYGVSVSK